MTPTATLPTRDTAPSSYLRPGPDLVQDGPPIALIPERSRPAGPVTTQRLRRTLAAYAGTVVIGSAIARLAGDRPIANAGVGLIAPGAGFISGGRPMAYLTTQAGFGLSLAAWLGSGNIVAPLATWLGTAAASARPNQSVAHPAARHAVPASAACAVAGALAARQAGHRKALRRRDLRNGRLRQLSTAPAAKAEPVARRIPAIDAGPELTPEQLALTRYALDRALQPVESFDGFDHIDQFQTSSVRYQVCGAGIALATLQYARTPAFHGYLSLAQRNLIDKWQERICWAYWAKESAWGHLRYDPNPVPRDNIMLTGWLGYQLAGYISNTGDTRYSEPGSITFKHPRGQRYEYNIHSLTETLVENFDQSDYTLFPCEPNWIYALCNGYGILPLPIHDRLFGTNYCERILPSFRAGFEQEFLSVDGRTIGIKSSMTGLSIPAMTSILSDAAVIWQLNPIFPDLARGLWEILRKESVSLPPDGPVQLDLRGWDKIDTGNYKRVPVTALSAISGAALEMGDTELAARLTMDAEATLEPVTESGIKRYAAASVQGNFALLLGQVGTAGSHLQRIARGIPSHWKRGPVLDECRYPNVLVARAVSDGNDLQLVLRPGGEASRERLGIANLDRGRSYDVTGAIQERITADHDGTARLDVDLTERSAIRITRS